MRPTILVEDANRELGARARVRNSGIPTRFQAGHIAQLRIAWSPNDNLALIFRLHTVQLGRKIHRILIPQFVNHSSGPVAFAGLELVFDRRAAIADREIRRLELLYSWLQDTRFLDEEYDLSLRVLCLLPRIGGARHPFWGDRAKRGDGGHRHRGEKYREHQSLHRATSSTTELEDTGPSASASRCAQSLRVSSSVSNVDTILIYLSVSGPGWSSSST